MTIEHMTVNLVAWAKAAAVMAHESVGQTRKYGSAHYGRERYYFHSCRVAELVATVTDDVSVIAAAALHDVLEDVSPKSPIYTPSWILAGFGHKVLYYVVECSNFYSKDDGQRRVLLDAIDALETSTFPVKQWRNDALASFMIADGLNREARKQLEAERYGSVSAEAKIIKRADLFDNSLSMESAPASFVDKWMAEKALAEGHIGSSWLEYEQAVRESRSPLVPA
jgi:hypothetical protein